MLCVMEQPPKISNTKETDNRSEKIRLFEDKHIPKWLRTQKKVNLIISAGLEHFFANKAEINGLEKIPKKGPFIVISNHFNVDELMITLGILKKYDAHVVASKKMHGEHPLRKILLKWLRGITTPDTLTNLSDKEKEELIGRIPDNFIKQKYKDIVEDEQKGVVDKTGLLNFVRSSVALLSRGDVLVIYPEGLWLYDGDGNGPRGKFMYKGYGGFDVIARQYNKLTGQNVPIVPIAVYDDEENNKRTVKINDAVVLDNDKNTNEVDFCMRKISEMLPQSQRGYYK